MNEANSHYILEDNKVFLAACIVSAVGALVFNAFPLFLSATADQFGFNLEEMGFLASAFLAGFALAALVAPIWMIAAEWRVTGIVSAAFSLGAITAIGFITDPSFVYLGMGVLGAGSGMAFTIGLTILARARDPERAFGIKLMYEMGLAGLVMLVMTKFIIAKFGFTGFVVGTFAIYFACMAFVAGLPENFMRRESSAAEEQEARSKANPIPAWVAVLALFIQFAAFSALWGFMERIGGDNGVDAALIGTILTLSIVAGFGGASLAALFGNKYGHVRPLVLGLCAAILSAVLLALSKSTVSFVIGACVINAMLQYTVAYQMGLIAHNDYSGRIGVMIPFILASSAAVGPPIAGTIAEAQGFTIVYWGFAIVSLVSIALTIWIGKQVIARE